MESLIFPLLIVGFLYFFMIAPQRRKMKAHRQLLNSLNEGDEVLTNAGIYGAVAEVEDNVIWLEVAPEVELKVQKASIAQVVSQAGDTADDDAETADDADASD
ncbi:MAG: preprotein translocase subunit YajC [Acidimicrobiaceae bacterium]|nr:preprotein translocase subunit YajC [Acidimicrobiaceae bacterium]